MPARKTAFDRYVDEQKKSPTFAAEYERVGAEIRAVDDLIRAVDAARLDLGMSKADLARKISTTPEAVRRLLTSKDANPTITTVLGVLEALGLRLAVVPAAAYATKPLKPAKNPDDGFLAKLMARAQPVREKQSAFTKEPQLFAAKPAAKKPPQRKTA